MASSSSVTPSQSSSTPLQYSSAPGNTAASPSSQSLASEVKPEGAEQATSVVEASPKPSPSLSAYQVEASMASSSSVTPSQSSSTPLQYSSAPGKTAAALSSQSLASMTKPEGALQAWNGLERSP